MSRVTPVLLYSLTGAVVLSSLSSCKEKKSEEVKKTMNVVYIMCDDHSYQTISAYDQRYMQTPNIDRIANEGVRFTNSFVANSLSGPSRACMLTGKHSHANGFTDNTTTFDGNQQTFPKLLQANGYQTAMIGKWHLVSEPTGFDYWDILIGQGDYYNPKFIKNGERVQREGYATNIVTDLAINWMDSIRDKSKPFCLFIHHKAPHRTWMPDLCDLDLYDDVIYPMPENFYDKYEGRIPASKQEMSIIKDMDLVYDLKMADKENEIHTTTGLEEAGRNMYNALNPEQKAAWDKHYDPIIARFKKDKLTGKALAEWKYQRYLQDYMACVASVDESVGEILDYLKRTGLDKNTIVVYTTDQGFYLGEHGWFDKRFMYEESFGMPMVMSWPGHIKPGTQVTGLTQNIDFAPTFLDMCGIEIPEDMQGVSFRRLVERGITPRNWRKSLYYHYYEFPGFHSVRAHYGVKMERYKLMHFYNDIDCWELYDLQEDRMEMHNIYGQSGTEELVKELKTELLRLQVQYDDPIRNIYKD